jgi:hypothetical protein
MSNQIKKKQIKRKKTENSFNHFIQEIQNKRKTKI